jgi:hypothetical protein
MRLSYLGMRVRAPDRAPVPIESLAGFGKLLLGQGLWLQVENGWRPGRITKVTKTRVRIAWTNGSTPDGGCWRKRTDEAWPRDQQGRNCDKPRWVDAPEIREVPG